jgi:hypothetical protein
MPKPPTDRAVLAPSNIKPVGVGDVRVSPVASFESSVDLSFVRSKMKTRIDSSVAFAGRSSLRIDHADVAKIDLATLLMGRPFPDRWSMIRLWVRGEVTSIELHGLGPLVAGRSIVDGVWTRVSIDLPEPVDATTRPASLTLTIVPGGREPVYVDRLELVDNRRVAVEADDGWRVWRAGSRWWAGREGGALQSFDSVEGSPIGFSLIEASALRARFRSSRSAADVADEWTIDRHGRIFHAGTKMPMTCEIEIDAAGGRVDRNSAGDVQNDGFDESRGAFRVDASSPRLTARLTPTQPIAYPMFEIIGLPAGELSVSMDGQRVETVARIDNGVVLVELPGVIHRPVSVDVRVR